MENITRVMVDMSATIIHHGHIRLLKKAAEIGAVVVGLTTDEEILKNKGYYPELEYMFRKEVLESIKYVDEVVKTPWKITQGILQEHNIDKLLHGDDNSNLIDNSRLIVVPRTEGISSSHIRKRVLHSITTQNNNKLMLTPGPGVVLSENLEYLKPMFGRGDNEYKMVSEQVLEWIKSLTGQDQLVIAQGSSTFALEMAAHTFISGEVLLISTGYYSDRLANLLPPECNLTICELHEIENINRDFDWVMCVYTETSVAFKLDLQKIKCKSKSLGAKLYVDATGSIGLEEHHELADVMAFSSCKGLFGLTGACFIAFKDTLVIKRQHNYYSNINTHIDKMVTGPYHVVASLYGVMHKHNIFKQRVIKSKNAVLARWPELVRNDNQPLLCTYIKGDMHKNDNNIVTYKPRSKLIGSVICHLGEIHIDKVDIVNRIKITSC